MTTRADARDLDQLLGAHYGCPAPDSEAKRRVRAPYGRPVDDGRRHAAPSLSMSTDDGELLDQIMNGEPVEEYVLDAPPALPSAPVHSSRPPAPSPVTPHPTPSPEPPPVPTQAPSQPPTQPPSHQPPPAAPPAGPTPGGAQTIIDPPHATGSTPPTDRPRIGEEDLLSDMQAILSGGMSQEAGGSAPARPAPARPAPARPASAPQRAAASRPPSGPAAPEPLPAPVPTRTQTILEQIAHSMEYATTYDLGTRELLQRRFSDLDRAADQRSQAQSAPRPAPPAARAAAAPSQVIRDLDAIADQRAADQAAGTGYAPPTSYVPPTAYTPPTGYGAGTGAAYGADLAPGTGSAYGTAGPWSFLPGWDATCGPTTAPLSLSPPVSRPFFDTGEHVRAGGTHYPDQLRVGPGSGVPFSYGQLIAMPDLYGSVDQMMSTSTTEIAAIKALVQRSTAFYVGGARDRALSVSGIEWNNATGRRYMQLAEDNYEHFSPTEVITPGAPADSRGTNRTTWEAHHVRAITEAQAVAIDPANADRSVVPEWPLIINAFGDHFLTDAFASGHLINKESMIAAFRRNFFNGSDLTSAGQAFFLRVAEAAFVGEVRRQFSALETGSYPVCAKGWCLTWRPNINSVSRFRDLLVEAATTEPVKVANFAVLALHDHLNSTGVEVTNDAGSGVWTLFGDEHLDTRTLGVMSQAVDQSAANIVDPSILASNLDPAPFLQKVWRYVPRPTTASRATLARLVAEYTNPASTTLSTAAAQIITQQASMLINVLVEEGKLRPA